MGKIAISLDPALGSPFNRGEFQGWGTSLCWWANRLGHSEKLTRQAAEAFFSKDGLCLDIARYNLGGGDDPGHEHIMRSDSRMPGVWKSFEMKDGQPVIEYDISRDQSQLNVAKAALKANPDLYFEGFSNSAPYFMTESGCTGGGTPADRDNLRQDMYGAFGRFIAEATGLFRREGIAFRSYSPMNEPDTDFWREGSPKQEGCHFSPGESQSRAVIETRRALEVAGLHEVLVAGMDETSLDQTVRNFAQLTPEAQAALGRIDTHSYQGTDRTGVKATAEAAGKGLWMSEVDGEWDGLQLAQHIIDDMNGMQPSAWVMWNIVDFYRDQAFTDPRGAHPEAGSRLDPAAPLWGCGMADFDTQTLCLANKYYFFGQFTRYIRPGDSIIASSERTLAAYNRRSGEIKIVMVNTEDTDREYEFDLSAFGRGSGRVKAARTNNLTGDGAERWKEISDEGFSGGLLCAAAKAGTVTTCVIRGLNG